MANTSRNTEIIKEIRLHLHEMQDEKYGAFQKGLIPMDREMKMIGVRTPLLRSYAKELRRMNDLHFFLEDLPHAYFEENQLHAFVISLEKDYETCLSMLKEFLPYVDNWATCDQMRPVCFAKHKEELKKEIENWMASDQPYIIRFGIGMCMVHYLDEAFDPSYPKRISEIRSDHYYVNMMRAWYFAESLAKQYDACIPYIEEKRLDTWTHNKAIQKAIESRRISPETKTYLRTLKIGKEKQYECNE